MKNEIEEKVLDERMTDPVLYSVWKQACSMANMPQEVLENALYEIGKNSISLKSELEAKDKEIEGLKRCDKIVGGFEWSPHTKPNDQIHYDHVLLESPLGKFSIEWKSWKDYPIYDIHLDGEILPNLIADDLDDAKAVVKKFIVGKLSELMGFCTNPTTGES